MLAIRAIKYEEKSVAAGLAEKLAPLAFEFGVEQHWRLNGIPVVHVVGRRLKIPSKLPGVGIQSHDRTGVKIVAGASLAREHGIRISRAPIKKIQFGVVGARHPRHATSVQDGVAFLWPRFRTRLAGFRLGVPAPLDLACLRIDGFEKAGNVRHISRNADDHVIVYDQWRHRREILELWIGKLDDPAHTPVFSI